jgi:aldose 1-epimerase
VNELPSGRQYTIVHGADRATVVEVGGGLRSYIAGGRELLDGYAEDEMATSARGQPLIPWPNRLRDGRYSWDGQTHQAPLSEPDKGNAIHGFLRFANWTCLGSTTSGAELGHVLHPRPGYPFTLAARLSYRIGPAGLTVTTTARNVGTRALPYASGQTPT